MKISIIGLGWFGSSLAKTLKNSHEVLGTTRDAARAEAFSEAKIKAQVLNYPETPSEDLLSSDVIVLNIPPFKDQLEWFKTWQWQHNAHIIFISSTSVYGDQKGECDEELVPQPSTENGKLLLEEELWVKTFPHHTIIRFGGLIGKERHPGKILSGRKNLKDPDSPVNLIHLDDTIAFTELVISRRLTQETFNLVSPEHPTRKEYYSEYCRRNNLPLPEFDPPTEAGKIISQNKVLKLYQHQVKLRNS